MTPRHFSGGTSGEPGQVPPLRFPYGTLVAVLARDRRANPRVVDLVWPPIP
jgi:hypothetical protein